MAPDAASSLLSAAAASKRPAASDADPLDSLPPQGGDGDQEASRKKQNQQQQLECPRCRSTNTKFCYYNNYSTTQPRHFCRACRRYWTHGGTLRDVPVGGASRRSGGNKRRRVDGSTEPSSGSPPTSARAEDNACGPDQLTPLGLFPFLNDGGVFLPPQLSLGAVAPAAFSWAPSAVPDLYYYGLAPWDGAGARGDAVTGAWDNFTDIAGLDLSWPPPGYRSMTTDRW